MWPPSLATALIWAFALSTLCPFNIEAAPKPAKTPAVADEADSGAAIDGAGGDGGMAEGSEVAAPQSRPAPPTTGSPAAVTFTAYLSEGSSAPMTDVIWRIYAGRPSKEGTYRLLQTVRDPHPTVDLNPGEYLVNAAYGRASLTKKIGIWPEKPVNEDFIVNAGGLRLSATLARGPIASENLLKFELFSETQDQSGNRQRIADIRPGVTFRLNSGLYHVLSTYGDANSVIASDVVIEPGKITEAVIDHDAGRVTLKLVQKSGAEAVADTKWTLFNANGEVIKESAGAFPTHILSAGDYRVAAQHGERQYAGSFAIAPGDIKLIEVLMQ